MCDMSVGFTVSLRLSQIPQAFPPAQGLINLFRGFSFVDTAMLEEEGKEEPTKPPQHPVVQVNDLLYVKIHLK